MSETKLTGRRRHRVQKRMFGKKPVLVLQLEVEGYVPECSGGLVDGRIKKWWIDARAEHLTVTEG